MNKTYQIFLKPSAIEDLDKIPSHQDLKKIELSIGRLGNDPRPPGTKKLENRIHRLRVGKWRVLYGIFDKETKLAVFRVHRRNEKTYKFIKKRDVRV